MPIKKYITSLILAVFLPLYSFSSLASLHKLENFGDNPGDIEASYFIPKTSEQQNTSLPLVVLLHGCAQKAEELAQQSGLLGLAKQHKFALLLPQQALTNNIKRCFNWYSPDDYTLDKGETLSIKNMITSFKQQIFSKNVYIIGLSAGGAMTSSILVNYPELFTAGAVVAGIPFPCADGLIKGISCMRNGPSQTSTELATLIQSTKDQSSKSIIWPKISVWTGVEDGIVNPLNSTMLAEQWVQLSGIESPPKRSENLGYKVTQWQHDNDVSVELVEVLERGHGIMVNPKEKNGGEVADYVLSSPVSTAKHVIGFWNL